MEKKRRLRAEKLMLLNCAVGKDSRVPWTARTEGNAELLLDGYRISVLQTETEFKHYCLEDGYTAM